jgi:hypothetical protein
VAWVEWSPQNGAQFDLFWSRLIDYHRELATATVRGKSNRRPRSIVFAIKGFDRSDCQSFANTQTFHCTCGSGDRRLMDVCCCRAPPR